MTEHKHLNKDLLREWQKPLTWQLRENVLELFAKQKPSQEVSCSDLISLIGYHWPNGLAEQEQVLHSWIINQQNFPPRRDAQKKINSIFTHLLTTGLTEQDLEIATKTCFPHITILDGEIASFLRLGFRDNTPEFGLECVVDSVSLPITLNHSQLKQSIKSFFQLFWGYKALAADVIVFNNKPFNASSLQVIQAAIQSIQYSGKHCIWNLERPHPEMKKLGWSCSPDFQRPEFMLVHFEEKLSEQKLNSVENFLRTCEKVCQRKNEKTEKNNIKKTQHQNIFMIKAGLCHITYQGETLLPLNATKALRDVGERLASKHEKWKPPVSFVPDSNVTNKNVREALTNQYFELREKLEYASGPENRESIKEEISKIKKVIQECGGSIGKNNTIFWNTTKSDVQKKSRHRSIDRGIKAIAQSKISESLTDHLEKYLKPGKVYNPPVDQDIDWYVDIEPEHGEAANIPDPKMSWEDKKAISNKFNND